MSYVDRFKKPRKKVVILSENIRWLLWTGALVDIGYKKIFADIRHPFSKLYEAS